MMTNTNSRERLDGAKPAKDKTRIIVASHRLPWNCEWEKQASHWKLTPRKGHSAQYSGTRSLSDLADVVISVGMVEPNIPNDSSFGILKSVLWAQKQCVPVYIDPLLSLGHYEGYCKSELWPLFHYVLWDTATDGKVETKNWNSYVEVQQRFADAIWSMYQDGDKIWVQDYHLLLLPSMLRKILPNAMIGYFLHTPFPSSEVFRCLPKRVEILSGILASNLVGFQTFSHSRHFISSCTRVLGLESTLGGIDYHGLEVAVEIFPVGIDLGRVQQFRTGKNVLEKIALFKSIYAGKKIIIGRDKLDLTKGLIHKLASFEHFLQLYPNWKDKVVLVQVTESTKGKVTNIKISEMVSRINGIYGGLEFIPIHHHDTEKLCSEDYYALLSIADVALVTSTRDGMNTTSHEFIVCQQERKGALILSEFTGSAGALSGALLVNPWDHVDVAHVINDALTMSLEERTIKHSQLYQHVSSNSASFWARSFITELRLKSEMLEQPNATPELNLGRIMSAYTKGKKRLLLFDYDGTLTPIVKIPSAALPPKEMLQALQKLVEDPRNLVFVISGRDQTCLDEWLGSKIKGLGLSAEHGSFIKYPFGNWINLAQEIDFTWKKDVEDIFNYYEERTPGSFTEHKVCSITWHYRLADPELGIYQSKECHQKLEKTLLSKNPIEILNGKKNLEVRPISMNKGEIVRRLLTDTCDFMFCAGDDRTDEDMFVVINKAAETIKEAHTCSVGPPLKKTVANWHVLKPENLINVVIEFARASGEFQS